MFPFIFAIVSAFLYVIGLKKKDTWLEKPLIRISRILAILAVIIMFFTESSTLIICVLLALSVGMLLVGFKNKRKPYAVPLLISAIVTSFVAVGIFIIAPYFDTSSLHYANFNYSRGYIGLKKVFELDKSKKMVLIRLPQEMESQIIGMDKLVEGIETFAMENEIELIQEVLPKLSFEQMKFLENQQISKSSLENLENVLVSYLNAQNFQNIMMKHSKLKTVVSTVTPSSLLLIDRLNPEKYSDPLKFFLLDCQYSLTNEMKEFLKYGVIAGIIESKDIKDPTVPPTGDHEQDFDLFYKFTPGTQAKLPSE